MKYIQFREKFSVFPVFTMNDIRKNDPGFDSRRLTEWTQKGYLKRLARNCYVFSEMIIDEKILSLLANKIYSPSYISLEMALSYYNLIPEGVYTITSVSTKKTAFFKTMAGNFSYRKIKSSLFFGYRLITADKYSFQIADMEKAILDYLYFNPGVKHNDDFFEMRFNKEVLLTSFDKRKFLRYLSIFNKHALSGRAKNFLKFIKNDQY